MFSACLFFLASIVHACVQYPSDVYFVKTTLFFGATVDSLAQTCPSHDLVFSCMCIV